MNTMIGCVGYHRSATGECELRRLSVDDEGFSHLREMALPKSQLSYDGSEARGAGVAAGFARPRKIVHIDMDAFYASVEQRDNPKLRGKPVAVGGSRERGVVAAASYEAREFGVRSAMASVTARRKCPRLVFVHPRFEVYRAVSHQIRAIFAEYTNLIEPLALDEAYLDVTENLKNLTSATEVADQIRSRIRLETGLTASAGVSYNKFLAKLASGHRKPDGLFVITPKKGPGFVERLPVSRFHGIGPVTCSKMEELGIHTGADLRARTLEFLQQQFGKAGSHYYWIARGIDDRPVCADRIRQSIGVENTFHTDLFTIEEARAAINPILQKVWSHCERSQTYGRTVTLKVKYSDFQQITRSRTSETPFTATGAVEGIVSALLDSLFPVSRGIRLLGVTISSLNEKNTSEQQLRLSI